MQSYLGLCAAVIVHGNCTGFGRASAGADPMGHRWRGEAPRLKGEGTKPEKKRNLQEQSRLL